MKKKKEKYIWVFGHKGWIKIKNQDIRDIFELQNTRFILTNQTLMEEK